MVGVIQESSSQIGREKKLIRIQRPANPNLIDRLFQEGKAGGEIVRKIKSCFQKFISKKNTPSR